MVWHSQILRYELLRHARRVTAGPSKRALLTTPAINGKNKFTLARPKRGAYVVQLAPGMTGDIQQAGQSVAVTELLAGPPAAPPRRRAARGDHRPRRSRAHQAARRAATCASSCASSTSPRPSAARATRIRCCGAR